MIIRILFLLMMSSSTLDAQLVIDSLVQLSYAHRDSFDLSAENTVLNEIYALAKAEKDETRIAWAQLNIGINLLNQSKYDSSEHYLISAQQNYAQLSDTINQILTQEYLANAYQQQNQLTKAIETYRALIYSYETKGDFESIYYAIINRCNTAYVHILQRNYQRAIDFLKPCFETEAALQGTPEGEKLKDDLSVNYNLFTARAYQELNQIDSAMQYYEITLKTSQRIQYPYTEGYAYSGIGYCLSQDSNKLNQAQEAFDSAIDIFRAINDKEGLLSALNYSARNQMKLRAYKRSEGQVKEALMISQEIGHIEGLKDAYLIQSELLNQTGNPELSLSYYKKHVAQKDSILSIEKLRSIQDIEGKYQKREQDREIEFLSKETQLKERQLFLSWIIGALLLIGIIALANFIMTRQRLKQVKKSAAYEKSISSALDKFVPNKFLSTIGKEHILDVSIGDQKEAIVTILFTDIRSFTTISESMTPADNFRFVKEYAERMGPIIRVNNGFINQYLGDGIMAIFQDCPDDALNACIQMQQEVRLINEKENSLGIGQTIRVGMGMHTGPLVMGIIGDDSRQDAAIISDTVNSAARLESLTKPYGANIILSESSLLNLKEPEAFTTRYLGSSMVKGKTMGIKIYECINGDHEAVKTEKLNDIARFTEAMDYIETQQVSEAKKILTELSNSSGSDKVIRYLLSNLE